MQFQIEMIPMDGVLGRMMPVELEGFESVTGSSDVVLHS
jgi:hypothetical protein